MPFPSLNGLVNQKFPVFNVTEEIQINHEKFVENVRYINVSHNRIFEWSLSLALILFICLFFAGCFQVIYLMNEPVEQKVDERVQRLEEQ